MSGAGFSRRANAVGLPFAAAGFALTLTACSTPPAPPADGGEAGTEADAPAAASEAPSDEGDAPVARADLGGAPISGSLLFASEDGRVLITAEVEGAPPGPHGLHIHEIGDCSAEDFTSAGGHFNPTDAAHGGPTDDERHAGDLGNIEIGPDGAGSLEISSDLLTLDDGPSSVIGRAVILHAGADDLTSQPTGAAGGRLACGVIGWEGAMAQEETEWKEGEVSFDGDEPAY